MTTHTGIHPAIMGLLQLLPAEGAPWPGKRDWLAAFTAVIAAVYPESEAAAVLD